MDATARARPVALLLPGQWPFDGVKLAEERVPTALLALTVC